MEESSATCEFDIPSHSFDMLLAEVGQHLKNFRETDAMTETESPTTHKAPRRRKRTSEDGSEQAPKRRRRRAPKSAKDVADNGDASFEPDHGHGISRAMIDEADQMLEDMPLKSAEELEEMLMGLIPDDFTGEDSSHNHTNGDNEFPGSPGDPEEQGSTANTTCAMDIKNNKVVVILKPTTKRVDNLFSIPPGQASDMFSQLLDSVKDEFPSFSEKLFAKYSLTEKHFEQLEQRARGVIAERLPEKTPEETETLIQDAMTLFRKKNEECVQHKLTFYCFDSLRKQLMFDNFEADIKTQRLHCEISSSNLTFTKLAKTIILLKVVLFIKKLAETLNGSL